MTGKGAEVARSTVPAMEAEGAGVWAALGTQLQQSAWQRCRDHTQQRTLPAATSQREQILLAAAFHFPLHASHLPLHLILPSGSSVIEHGCHHPQHHWP